MIKILLFAQLQEEVGKHELELKGGPRTVEELRKELADQFNLLQLEQSMIAINERYAKNKDMVSPGDIVAIIPPISGG